MQLPLRPSSPGQQSFLLEFSTPLFFPLSTIWASNSFSGLLYCCSLLFHTFFFFSLTVSSLFIFFLTALLECKTFFSSENLCKATSLQIKTLRKVKCLGDVVNKWRSQDLDPSQRIPEPGKQEIPCSITFTYSFSELCDFKKIRLLAMGEWGYFQEVQEELEPFQTNHVVMNIIHIHVGGKILKNEKYEETH